MDDKRVDQLKSELNDISKKIDTIVEDGVEVVKSKIPSVTEVKDKAQESWNTVKDTTTDKAKQADTYARENPWIIAAAAAGVGLLLGAITGKRRKK